MFIDYYKTLGVDKAATQAQIKSAYRKLARKFHPDLNPNDKDAKKNFQLINEANEVLSDPEKRAKYDQYGKEWKHAEEYQQATQSGRQQYTSQNQRDFTGTGYESEFSDFFESLFGGFRDKSHGRKVKFRGEDYNAELHLGLRDAYRTRKQELDVNGRKIRITIPAGVENEQTIKIPGMGGQGVNGGPPGDLFIKFIIANDASFKRLKNDLYKIVDLDLYTAVLGGEIIVETIDGKIKLSVRPGTQTGSKIRLKGKGFPVYKSDKEFGDLVITFNVLIPQGITSEEKELFSKLAALHNRKTVQ